jgi:hypothetical protein
MIELKDYELIPSEEDGQAWNVRLLTGPFTETVLRFGSISFNEIEEGMMSFNFHIVYSPDENLTTEVVELQECAGDLLQAIIRDGIETGSVITKEKDSE